MNHPFSLGGRAERALFGSWLTSAVSLFAVVVPKCPLCLAAYLGLFGVSASSARAVVKLGLPLCLTLIAGCALATALFVARRGQRSPTGVHERSTCCTRSRARRS
jgi:hypothetical protein